MALFWIFNDPKYCGEIGIGFGASSSSDTSDFSRPVYDADTANTRRRIHLRNDINYGSNIKYPDETIPWIQLGNPSIGSDGMLEVKNTTSSGETFGLYLQSKSFAIWIVCLFSTWSDLCVGSAYYQTDEDWQEGKLSYLCR